MYPIFNFTLGKPECEASGRWVEGSIRSTQDGYRFSADLMRRRGSVLSCQRVWLDIARAFAATDFAAYLRLVSTGHFETDSGVLDLYETSGLDPEAASAIFAATAAWVDPWEQDSHALLEELTALGDKLEQARKRELLGLALAQFSRRRR